MHRNKKKESIFFLVLRIIVGLTFIFSSVVKGVDPLGTAYRVEDYLEVYGWYSLVGYSLYLGLFLIIVEFLLGISMLFRLRFKLGSLGVLLIMIIFTAVTYFDAKLELVPDCGCFGDAVKLTNWETFYKNVVLIIIAFILFFGRKSIWQVTPKWFQYTLLSLFSIIFIGFIYYNISHLPLMDFRSWKVGNDMKTIGEEKAKVYLTYKNDESGEIKEYLSPNYPWNDSIWLTKWTFVGQRFDNSGVIKMHELIIEDGNSNDYTKDLIENPETQVLLIINDLDNYNEEGLKKAMDLKNGLNDNEYFAIVAGTDYETAEKFINDKNIDSEIFIADDIELKAMIRSNPGIVVLVNGVVVQKLHHNDFPEKLEYTQ